MPAIRGFLKTGAVAIVAITASVLGARGADMPTDAGAPVVGARAVGVGGVTATLRDDPAGLFGNPSAIVGPSRFFADASQGAFGATAQLGAWGTLGVGALDLNRADRLLIERAWNPLGTFETGTNRAAAGYAVDIAGRLAVGAALEGWRDSNGEWTQGANAGLIAHPSSALYLGAAFLIPPDGRPVSRYGFLVEPTPGFRLLGETERGRARLGIESVWQDFGVRGGVRVTTDAPERDVRWSVGASAHLAGGLTVHYAYAFDRRDLPSGEHAVSFEVPVWRRGRGVARRRVVRASPAQPSSVALAAPEWLPVQPQRTLRSAVDSQPDIPPEARGSLRLLIEHHSRQYGVEEALILATMRAESSFNPRAVSSSQAVGLFQLLPPAARDMGIALPEADILDPAIDPRFDPIVNADAGIRYLAHLLQRFGWNYALALAAYNAGPSLVNGEVPRRPETERHVAKVLNYYYHYKNDRAAREQAWQTVGAIPLR
jgi:soluble lytic murein transglycosylase-like protein